MMRRKRRIGLDDDICSKMTNNSSGKKSSNAPSGWVVETIDLHIIPKSNKDCTPSPIKHEKEELKQSNKRKVRDRNPTESEDENENLKKPKIELSNTSTPDYEPQHVDINADTELVKREKEQSPNVVFSDEQQKFRIDEFRRRSAPPLITRGPHYGNASFSHFTQYPVSAVAPIYKGYQLLGDSQFIRFAKKILHEKNFTDYRNLHYCVSGQKIEDLYNMLLNKTFELHSKVIVLIGTNNLKDSHHPSRMIEDYDKMLKLLKSQTEKIVLVTIPPLYKKADSIQQWKIFKKFNKHILKQHNGDQVSVVDLGIHLIGYPGVGPAGNQDYYEKAYYMDNRTDLIHLNHKGLRLLQFLLDLHYFDKVCKQTVY